MMGNMFACMAFDLPTMDTDGVAPRCLSRLRSTEPLVRRSGGCFFFFFSIIEYTTPKLGSRTKIGEKTGEDAPGETSFGLSA